MPIPDSSPAPEPTDAPAFSENELDYEMTPEREEAFVNEVLGLGEPVAVITPTPVEPVVEPIVEPVVELVAEPVIPVVEPVVEPTPQEIEAIKTDDLFIEVEVSEEDDLGEVTTKTVKLTYDPLHPENFIPDDFTAKNTKQLSQIMEAKAEMAGKFKERQADYDTKLSEKSKSEESAKQIASWDQEIADLIEAGAIEAPKAKTGDPKYGEDPSVKLTDEVFKFMALKNNERAEKGVVPIASFSLAFTMYQQDADRIAQVEAKKKENEDAKRKGSMVGGGSAASTNATEKPVYTQGSAKNIWDVDVPE